MKIVINGIGVVGPALGYWLAKAGGSAKGWPQAVRTSTRAGAIMRRAARR